jgi:serine/threonine-protein kinase
MHARRYTLAGTTGIPLIKREDDEHTPDNLRTGGGLDMLAAVDDDPESLIGSRIAHYRIYALLAEGGMGQVYLGERTDGQFERKAAIKILPKGVGVEYIRRFEQERAILAGLNHPNIAHLYDAGISDTGNLYLVMELVDGDPIDEHCRTEECTIDEKISLLIELCNALAFAHGRLVLHRDIKPSNVLVSSTGQVKLLDFGIAKMIESEDEGTRGRSPMTPQYASPEQLLGDTASIASDVFQVGILMHLLLAGRTPFEELDLPTRIRQISEKRPVTLDDSVRQLPRDLQTILQHCLSTDPQERYGDTHSLAADLQRALDGFPLLIRPPGWASVFGKWLQRNKLASLSTGVLAAALLASTAWYTWSLNQSSTQAQREALVASQTRDLILDLLKAGDPLVAQGKDTTVMEVIDAGLASIRNAQIEDPEARVQLMHTLADVYHKLGAVRKALGLTRDAYEYSMSSLGGDHPMTWNSLGLLGATQMSTGDYVGAEAHYDELEAAFDRTGTTGHRRAELMNGQAMLYLKTGRYEQALQKGEAAVVFARAQLGERSEPTLNAINNLSEIYRMTAQADKAIELLTSRIPVAKDALGDLHPTAIGMTLNLAGAYYARDGLERAAPLLEEVRNKNMEVYGPNHPDTIRDTIFVGALYGETGRFEEAKTLIEEGIARHTRLFGAEHPNSLRYRASLMHLLAQYGNSDAALKMCDELVPLQRNVNGKDHWFTLETRTSCASARYESGQRERGAGELRSVLADMRRVFGDDFYYAVGTAAYMARQGIPEQNGTTQNGEEAND